MRASTATDEAARAAADAYVAAVKSNNLDLAAALGARAGAVRRLTASPAPPRSGAVDSRAPRTGPLPRDCMRNLGFRTIVEEWQVTDATVRTGLVRRPRQPQRSAVVGRRRLVRASQAERGLRPSRARLLGAAERRFGRVGAGGRMRYADRERAMRRNNPFAYAAALLGLIAMIFDFFALPGLVAIGLAIPGLVRAASFDARVVRYRGLTTAVIAPGPRRARDGPVHGPAAARAFLTAPADPGAALDDRGLHPVLRSSAEVVPRLEVLEQPRVRRRPARAAPCVERAGRRRVDGQRDREPAEVGHRVLGRDGRDRQARGAGR